VSAWDLQRGLLLGSEELLAGAEGTVFHNPRLLIVDSGCYEQRDASMWSLNAHDQLIADLPESSLMNIALVNFDLQSPYDDQIASAQNQLGGQEGRIKVCLLKPPEGRREHDLDALSATLRKARWADVIGVAEKDLGDTLGDRIRGVTRIRDLMDAALFEDTPLHLFGSLDPVLSPLYFVAGADIFDGLTWLRYAYHNGVGSYSDAVSIIDGDLSRQTEVRRWQQCRKNLEVLRTVQENMRILGRDGDWADLGPFGNEIRQAWRRATS
jgi:hypothetical protein